MEMLNYFVYSVIAAWLILISYFLFKTRRHYQNLISKTRKNKIDEILDSLIEDKNNIKNDLTEIKQKLHETIQKSNNYFKKIGIVRFNPFGKAGGDQSFVLSMLDNENNGLIINFIYTSDGLRVYTKKILKGKGKDYQLSEEEEKAIKESV
jgi:hypothetical protein